ncbi:hypothetical protein [Phaeocystidibacter luteus]|uniref:Uncharacterized protein n=1 Tax=Phaeocystidibacter luteus TaxID=911197 RepID=A0A6N6RIP5_9FLAO|nr:hypothetical protein [Phaeocystidibacter luteus]KAB2810248.1 hypothetical protein F8C67_06600 [Phaeocystidibacter luteus]
MKKIISTCLVLLSLASTAQHEELSQKLEAFAADHSEDYEKKTLNLDDPEIGDIEETNFTFSERYMLKSKERVMSNLDREIYARYYINAYAYYDEAERDYAMQYWLQNFIEGQSVRPGRDIRTYDYATPTIVIINETSIIVLNYECALYDRDSFREWRNKMLNYFGDPNSVIIEIKCGGPLEWTKNPPDRRDRRWR